MSKIGIVSLSTPSSILVKVTDLSVFENNKKDLQIGKYLKIMDGNNNYVIAIIQNIRILDFCSETDLKLEIDCQPIGTLIDNKFKRGVESLPLPTEDVSTIDKAVLTQIFSGDNDFNFVIGRLSQNKEIDFKIDGNKFFSKHVAVVGSTGAGKSCVVSKILHEAIGIEDGKNSNKSAQKNSHIVIFDIHSEYKSAFSLPDNEKFTLNVLEVDKLKLPYWLMNSEELEDIFIESNESNSHNQVSQFKHAVILNKKKYNLTIENITYDTPVYFNIKEVYHYIENMNREIIGKEVADKNSPKLIDGTIVTDRKDFYFEKIQDFVPSSQKGGEKASNGPFNGEFNRFVSRLETKLGDDRLNFLLKPLKDDDTHYMTDDFETIMKQFIGYIDKSNVTIIDLSGIPFEVLSITVSLISRLIFDFCFHYSKLKHLKDSHNDIPVMIVCEEAHNYVPKSGGVEYNPSRKSIERIAKEGRKYGLSLMVVSQRPSEISETILAQCNNFISLRLTNYNDQSYIKNLLPDCIGSICDILPSLSPGECLIVGDAALMPAIIKMDMPNPEPRSQSVKFHDEWLKTWQDITFADVVKRWKKEDLVMV
ncbi:MAG: ATPase [Candidatus Melainabacteria bacterium RIFOXYA12_FULL_32_12]|nr:MAG: ATPase [Candidatus Melainabacteria bacterium RIFOXYA12_FULL_32_12]